MDVLFVLFFLWVFITLLGHGSWLLVRAFFQAFSGPSEPAPPTAGNLPDDLAATRRILRRLAEREWITPQRHEELQRQLLQLNSSAAPPRPTPPPRVTAPPHPLDPSPASIATSPPVAPPRSPFSDPIPTATLVPAYESIASPVETTPAAPTLSRAEMIRSFMATYNIRWGELVAGMMIVICSIGLVISLWSPLVQTHRVIPSLIFLAANAAIYAAGLYTLSRWRLRHTSRAVLVIATLLVPLSVLAGLAAAGTTADAVRLTDPITVVSIAVSALVYVVWVYYGGRALVRRPIAAALTLAVCGPVAVLPLIPAATRVWQSDAGWTVALGAVSVAIAVTWMMRLRLPGEQPRLLGVAAGRTRLLVLALAGFSWAVLVGYAVFALRAFERDGWLTIAIAALPAVVAIAAAAHRMAITTARSTQSLVAMVTCVVLIGVAATTGLVMMISPWWLWVWALVAAASVIAVGLTLRQSAALPLATLPVGIAVTLSSHWWLGDVSWEQLGWWNRMVAGEPMLAAVMMATLAGIATVMLRDEDARRWMGWATVGWTSVAIAVAGSLALRSPDAMGAAPHWALGGVLAATMMASVVVATRRQDPWSSIASAAIWATVALASLFWIALWRPVQLFPLLPLGSSTVIMGALLSVATSLMAAVEITAAWGRRWRGDDAAIGLAVITWRRAAVGFTVVAAAVACAFVRWDAAESAIAIALAAVLLGWAATSARSVQLLQSSQLATLAMAIVIGYMSYDQWLFRAEAWQQGAAVFSWAILMAAVSVLWLPLRLLAGIKWMTDHAPRLNLLRSPAARPDQMPDGWTAVMSIGLIALAAVWSYASLLSDVAVDGGIEFAFSLQLPLIAIAVIGGWLLAMHWQPRSAPIAGVLAAATVTAVCIWFSGYAVHVWPWDAASRLVIATSAAAVAVSLIAVMHRWTAWRGFVPAEQAMLAVAIALIACSSSGLLYWRWHLPVSRGMLAEPFATISVATWWLLIAVAMLSVAKRIGKSLPCTIAACLIPAAAAILVPVVDRSNPVVWIQVAAITAIGVATLLRFWFRGAAVVLAKPAIVGSLGTGIAVGVATAVIVTLQTVAQVGVLDAFVGRAGFVVSALAIGLWCWGWPGTGRQSSELHREEKPWRLDWPLGLTLMAGQFVWLAHTAGWISGVQLVEVLVAIWTLAAGCDLIRSGRRIGKAPFVHVITVGIAAVLMAIWFGTSSWLPWIGLAALAIAGWMVGLTDTVTPPSKLRNGIARVVSWWVLVMGPVLLIGRISGAAADDLNWTLVVMWAVAWLVQWRSVRAVIGRSERAVAGRSERVVAGRGERAVAATAETELSSLVALAVLGEIAVSVVGGADVYLGGMFAEPLFWIRLVCYLIAGLSSMLPAAASALWSTSLVTIVGVCCWISVRWAIAWQADFEQRLVSGVMAAGFVIALGSHWLSSLARWMHRIEPRTSASGHLQSLVHAFATVAVAIATVAAVVAGAMIGNAATAAMTQLIIVSVALAAWALAVLAETALSQRLRHATVTVALAAIGLAASVQPGHAEHRFLEATMRWLVVSVFTTGMSVFAVPALLGPTLAGRWAGALRRSAATAAITAGGACVAMLITELVLRNGHGIASLSRPLVIGVAVTLAILSGVAAAIAVLSGPGSKLATRLNLTDRQRQSLVVAAQAVAAITWLHVFLCKANWAFLGLRGYWPFIVMGLAFASVGATQWAKRRRDDVLADIMSSTALYLPLVPVIGFWLSGYQSDLGWMFAGGKVRYDVLLTIGTIYYLAISVMWNGWMPRVAAIALGNAAWWVVLTEQPGWGFLSHPQAWLIPPAVCTLVVAHWYRQRLPAKTADAIRYAATLVIYVSSTADMFLQQIGTNLAGPIVLVVLALVGMAAGVILRVRPFLYLGAIFVFLGVTSMVWHAHLAIDAVWPWWVFGITTGIALLAGLMAIEKNKPQLQHYANELTKWH